MLEWSRTACLGYMSISWGHGTLVSSKSYINICAIYESSSIVKIFKKNLSNYFPVSFVFVHTVWVFPLGWRHFSKQQQMNNAKGIKGFFLHFSYMSHNTSVAQVKKLMPTQTCFTCGVSTEIPKDLFSPLQSRWIDRAYMLCLLLVVLMGELHLIQENEKLSIWDKIARIIIMHCSEGYIHAN